MDKNRNLILSTNTVTTVVTTALHNVLARPSLPPSLKEETGTPHGHLELAGAPSRVLRALWLSPTATTVLFLLR